MVSQENLKYLNLSLVWHFQYIVKRKAINCVRKEKRRVLTPQVESGRTQGIQGPAAPWQMVISLPLA